MGEEYSDEVGERSPGEGHRRAQTTAARVDTPRRGAPTTPSMSPLVAGQGEWIPSAFGTAGFVVVVVATGAAAAVVVVYCHARTGPIVVVAAATAAAEGGGRGSIGEGRR